MESLRQVSYKDPEGRMKVVLLPSKASDSEAKMGIPVGPPSLSELKLPKETEIRLNNELFHRGIITSNDAALRRQEVASALMAALNVDMNRVIDLYNDNDVEKGKVQIAGQKPSEE